MNERKNSRQPRRPAIDRIGNDDARMSVVDPGTIDDAGIRFSDEALDVLRRDGVEAYEQYIKQHTST